MNRVTFPHLGTLWIVIKDLLEGLGWDVVLPPPVTKKTINLGVQHSPEFACFPLKVNIGNFIEAIEKGADTIVMVGGIGPCRFGYYAQVEKEILQDLNYKFKMIVIDPPAGNWKEFWRKLAPLNKNGSNWREIMQLGRLVWAKITAMDRIHKEVLRCRPLEVNPGDATRVHDSFINSIEQIKNVNAVKEQVEKTLTELPAICRSPQEPPLKVGLLGEIYTLLEPYANMEIERSLGELGLEVERNIYLSDWLRDHVVSDPTRVLYRRQRRNAAKPYLDHFVGGHGLESVADSLSFAEKGYLGIVHVLPFTCTPEIVARSIFPRISRDKGIPIISFSMDEHTGKAGFLTRLEAFTDLLRQKYAVR